MPVPWQSPETASRIELRKNGHHFREFVKCMELVILCVGKRMKEHSERGVPLEGHHLTKTETKLLKGGGGSVPAKMRKAQSNHSHTLLAKSLGWVFPEH